MQTLLRASTRMRMVNEVIVVAVDASTEISDSMLEWAMRHVVKAMDSLILIAVLPSHGRNPVSGNRIHQFLACLLKKWGFRHNAKSSSDQAGHVNGVDRESSHRIHEVCTQMMRQLCSANNVRQVQTQVIVVPRGRIGLVANQAGELGATWVILDRLLKKESDCCLKQLNCNVVLIDHAIPKILRSINSQSVKKINNPSKIESNPTVDEKFGILPSYILDYNAVTTPSSIGLESRSPETDGSGSSSSEDKDNSQRTNTPITRSQVDKIFLYQNSRFLHQEFENQATYCSTSSHSKSQQLNKVSRFDIDERPRMSTASSSKEKIKSSSSFSKAKSDLKQGMGVKLPQIATIPTRRSTDSPRPWPNSGSSTQPKLLHSSKRDNKYGNRIEETASLSSSNIDRTSSIRKAMFLSVKQPPTPPPLCSVCKHKAPILGKSPRKFSYQEIERAIDGFSCANILAEGGYGSIYRGVLPDGQVVAVKRHKVISAQGASEFCSEVEVLSCAQHRNLVMLVGYSIEKEWLLVYEFSCNGSLDKHLYGIDTDEVMTWDNRMKVAIGAARGLRYLHEDCRVGCIVHRDFRPSNILLTHDFEPMVGDFGLARWQADGESAVETRVIGAFGYFAPEYTKTGLITDKADVYAFGVVLMELLTGLKATDLSRSEEQQYLPEWGRPLLENKMINEIIDPRLEGFYTKKEVECMMYAARLCISPYPERRPRMSKVLRILEGDMPSDMAYSYGQATSALEHKIKNGCSTSGLLNQEYSPSPHMIQSMHHWKPTQSSSGAEIDNNQEGIIRPMTSLEKYKMERLSSNWSLNQTEELVSEEYQAYLQGSLVEFLHKMDGS